MATTSKGFRYPSSSDSPNIPSDIANLASDVDSELDNYSLSDHTHGDFLPSQSGNNGKYLKTDGSAASWATIDLSSKQDVVAGVSGTEISYLDGVTGPIQEQLDSKLLSSTASSTYAPINAPTFTGYVTLSGSPSANLHAATKQYVDNAIHGLSWKPAVNLLVTTNISDLNDAGGTYDGHVVGESESGYRFLLKGQSTASENGIYVATWTSGAIHLSRPADADAYNELVGASVFVMEGDSYANTTWVQSNHYLTSFSAQVWSQAGGVSTSYTAGSGLILDGNEFSVDTSTIAPISSPSFSGTVSGSFSGSFSGDASGLYNVPASGLAQPTTAGSVYGIMAASFGGAGGPADLTAAAGYNVLANKTMYVTDNVALGGSALSALSSGGSNIAIGVNAGSSLTGGSYNILIGKNAQASSSSSQNEVVIGDEINIVQGRAYINQPLSKRGKLSDSLSWSTCYHSLSNDGSTFFSTYSPSQNWTYAISLRNDSSLTFNQAMNNGDIITIEHIVQQGPSAYIPVIVTLDGTSNNVFWKGGVSPTGHSNSIDVFTYQIIKIASDTFKILAECNQYKQLP